MTGDGRKSASSRKLSRIERLATSLEDRGFRQGYFVRQLKTFLASQIRALRGDMSQADFGKLIGKPQSVVSRLERENYGKVALQTLIDIAIRLDIALLVRFVSFPTFLTATNDNSPKAFAPDPYNKEQMDDLAKEERSKSSPAPRTFVVKPYRGDQPIQLIRLAIDDREPIELPNFDGSSDLLANLPLPQ